MKEIETKFKLKDPQAFRNKLEQIGAQKVYSQLEHDIYFAGQGCKVQASTIRVRCLNNNTGVFTIKKNVPNDQVNIKIKEEIEVNVDNAIVMTNMLKDIGFSERFKKEKKREIYKYNSANICLDELPYIGWYLEIEAEGVCEVENIAKALDLDINDAIKDTYMDLFNIYKVVKGKPKLEMVFDK
ncbi:MAG: class IV adenylate cyclase [Candidatus Omnitrophica bacterium]|nr:class IV adenylate cyclase [Candidatus Omnitrophota bacterium]